MTTVKITKTDTKVVLSTPYHPNLPSRAKALGGKFNPQNKTWVFDARDEQRVRDLAREIFGTDGSPITEPLVTVKFSGHMPGSEYWKFGRLIARRPGRDAEVQLGEGVVLVEGYFLGRNGSMRYPVIGGEGTVLEIRDVPLSMARRAIAEDSRFSIVEDAPVAEHNPLAQFSNEELLAELERRGIKIG